MTAAALLLFFWPWGDDYWGLPKLVACCACLVFWSAGRPVWAPARWKPWAAVFAALAISTLFSRDLGNSLFAVPNPMGLGLLQWVVCALCFLQGLDEDQDKWIVGAALAMAAFAILQMTGWEWLFTHPLHANGGRALSTQGSPVFLGFVLVIVAPVVRARSPYLLPFVLLVAALAAKCRSALVIIPAVLIFSWWQEWRNCEIALD